MKIGFLYNIRHVKPNINNPQYLIEAEFDTPETIAAISSSIIKLGHEVLSIEANTNAFLKLKKFKKKIDLVFNIAEGFRGQDREAHIPAILEMLGIPYTGPNPLGYAIGLNKSIAKQIVHSFGILTPRWQVIENAEEIKEKKLMAFPIIAKPLSEGSSKGICAKNLVHNSQELINIVKELLKEFKQPVLIEEYLPGREFTVGVLGNPPCTLPIIEIIFDNLPKGWPCFDHYEAKWIFDNPKSKFDPLICPAKVSTSLKQSLISLALRSFNALKFKDWARFDIRLDKRGEPNFIEVNCPPGIMPDPKENSRFVRAARVAGLTYAEMIEKVLQSACTRYGLSYTLKSRTKKHIHFA